MAVQRHFVDSVVMGGIVLVAGILQFLSITQTWHEEDEMFRWENPPFPTGEFTAAFQDLGLGEVKFHEFPQGNSSIWFMRDISFFGEHSVMVVAEMNLQVFHGVESGTFGWSCSFKSKSNVQSGSESTVCTTNMDDTISVHLRNLLRDTEGWRSAKGEMDLDFEDWCKDKFCQLDTVELDRRQPFTYSSCSSLDKEIDGEWIISAACSKNKMVSGLTTASICFTALTFISIMFILLGTHGVFFSQFMLPLAAFLFVTGAVSFSLAIVAISVWHNEVESSWKLEDSMFLLSKEVPVEVTPSRSRGVAAVGMDFNIAAAVLVFVATARALWIFLLRKFVFPEVPIDYEGEYEYESPTTPRLPSGKEGRRASYNIKADLMFENENGNKPAKPARTGSAENGTIKQTDGVEPMFKKKAFEAAPIKSVGVTRAEPGN
mmetsp:Transcript_59600/g.122183  ORF Transcript_59600/g.122183 Transcript_59600/m.122183 type:complete len:432 (-) Transcript_59600:193-1488(-)|eukprot:CAMPEP_0181300326 /NCGR_PEP_ID=MMETSP1101-20121128/6828_1 /TAXON_ID=46948 /ORGANISM="Rhodomonas abbreviata, Strain Caron Lab Isolate" /LENGTH=431 /DNA_ID=CAMNT_0023405551 /DNA_START=229 /DNA_END=1524 /DNA_ORIENTATION=-